MASVSKKQTKDGRDFYEIIVWRGADRSRLSSRWYPPEGWSRKSIDRELAKVTAEFERQVKAGEILSHREQKELTTAQALQAVQIKTFRQYAESVYMPALSVRCSENTRSSYQMNLEKWIFPSLGDLKMPDITAADIDAVLVGMQAQKKAHSTVIKIYTILCGIFKKAYKADIIDRNPMDKVDRPRARKDEVSSSAPDAYDVAMIRRIVSCLSNEPLKWRTFVHLLIDSGMRRGECCGLQWSDVDFEHNTITIQRSLGYTPKKGVYLDTTKNSRAHTIDIAPHVIELLKELRIAQSQKAISKFVFTQDGKPDPIHPQSPTRYLKRFEKKYGIPDFHPHKLRHSFASIAITHKADVASVSEKLGHSDSAVTLRMYTHANQESIKRAGDTFRNAISQDEGAATTVFTTVSDDKPISKAE